MVMPEFVEIFKQRCNPIGRWQTREHYLHKVIELEAAASEIVVTAPENSVVELQVAFHQVKCIYPLLEQGGLLLPGDSSFSFGL